MASYTLQEIRQWLDNRHVFSPDIDALLLQAEDEHERAGAEQYQEAVRRARYFCEAISGLGFKLDQGLLGAMLTSYFMSDSFTEE